MLRCLGASGFVRASKKMRFASRAREVQIFWPLTSHRDPLRTAVAFNDARSEPASGSEKAWHQRSCPERIRAEVTASAARCPSATRCYQAS